MRGRVSRTFLHILSCGLLIFLLEACSQKGSILNGSLGSSSNGSSSVTGPTTPTPSPTPASTPVTTPAPTPVSTPIPTPVSTPVSTPAPTPISSPILGSSCGMQLNTSSLAFCETFDKAYPVTTRAGQLDGTLWGVTRILSVGDSNAPTQIQTCNGTKVVMAPNDVIVCNGQLREATNDNASGGFDDGTVTSLAMYPKQPFDFAGRTGTVAFDVSNDSGGVHSAWPEFWITDTPAPDPFTHHQDWLSVPANAVGIRFESSVSPGSWGECPNGNNLDKWRVTVGSAVVSRNYIVEDEMADGLGLGCSGSPSCVNTGMTVTPLDCVSQDPAGPNGGLNHFEVQVSQNQIDVYGTDAGVLPTSVTMRHISVIKNVNLSFSRGLVWFEDGHYNADKGSSPNGVSQKQHTFAWDNIAFDGPILARDLAYDAPDNNQVNSDGVLCASGQTGGCTWNGQPTVTLAKTSAANQTASWSVPNLVVNNNAAAVKVLYNLSAPNGAPTTLLVTVNGHQHPTAWPYPDTFASAWRTLSVVIPITDLVSGTNIVQLGGSNQVLMTANVDIVLAGAGGIVQPQVTERNQEEPPKDYAFGGL